MERLHSFGYGALTMLLLPLLCCASENLDDIRSKRSVGLRSLDSKQAIRVLQYANPGLDFPVLSEKPVTSFTCNQANILPDTYVADVETGCQMFHKCNEHKQLVDSFLCPNYTIFNDQTQVCEWFHNVDCYQKIPASEIPSISTNPTISVIANIPSTTKVITSFPTTASHQNYHSGAIAKVVPVVTPQKQTAGTISKVSDPAQLANFQQNYRPSAFAKPSGIVDVVTEIDLSPAVATDTVVIAFQNSSSKAKPVIAALTKPFSAPSTGGNEFPVKPVSTMEESVSESFAGQKPTKTLGNAVLAALLSTSGGLSTSNSQPAAQAAASYGSPSVFKPQPAAHVAVTHGGPSATKFQPAPHTAATYASGRSWGPTPAATTGGNSGWGSRSSGFYGASMPQMSAGQFNVLPPSQQIQMYSSGMVSPFNVDPFFAPLRMFAPGMLAWLPPVMGMLPG